MVFYFIAYATHLLRRMGGGHRRGKKRRPGVGDRRLHRAGEKYPWLGVCMTLFLLSYAGVPLTVGFWGKYYLFTDVMDGGFPWLAAVGILASVISVFYYLRVIFKMFSCGRRTAHPQGYLADRGDPGFRGGGLHLRAGTRLADGFCEPGRPGHPLNPFPKEVWNMSDKSIAERLVSEKRFPIFAYRRSSWLRGINGFLTRGIGPPARAAATHPGYPGVR